MPQRDGRPRLETHMQRLFGYAHSLVQDADDAKILVQETVEETLRSGRVPDDASAYRVWLFSRLRTRVLERLQDDGLQAGRGREAATGDQSPWTGREEINPLAVRIAFARLALLHRDILGAVDVAGLTYAETADLLDVPVGTVMNRISGARAELYRHMQETRDDPKVRFFPLHRHTTSNG